MKLLSPTPQLIPYRSERSVEETEAEAAARIRAMNSNSQSLLPSHTPELNQQFSDLAPVYPPCFSYLNMIIVLDIPVDSGEGMIATDSRGSDDVAKSKMVFTAEGVI